MAFMSPKMSATINKNHTHDDKLHLPTAVKCGSPRYRPFFGKPITEMMDYSDLKQNKGSILKASVEYMKELKRDKYKLYKLEENQAVMDSKYQKLLFRIFMTYNVRDRRHLKKHWKQQHLFYDRKMNVLQIAEQIGKVNPIVCVPAGDNPDMCFLGSFAYSSILGKILDIDEAPQFARYSTNMVVASEIIGSVPTRNYSVDDVREAVRSKVKSSTSEKDICDIYEILTKRQAYGNGSYPNVDCVENDLRCEGDPQLPPIGTRVGRGPNWPFTSQNSGMSGTVVGYRDDRPDWKWFDQDGGKDNIGTVYRVKGDNIVRWTNGIKSNYRFGYDGKYDVILWYVV
uniref:E3 ubiquitin-protein ligase MIB2 n=1 Tax=Magallana gigas TaxID=29159 RepID=K1QJD9_MAGGI